MSEDLNVLSIVIMKVWCHGDKLPTLSFLLFCVCFICLPSQISPSMNTKKVVKHGKFYFELKQLAARQNCIRSFAKSIKSQKKVVA